MILPCIRVEKNQVQEKLKKLREEGDLIHGYKLKKDGDFILIPCKKGNVFSEFQEVEKRELQHIGSFERIADFIVIKERENWEKISEEIIKNRPPRAIFLDKGVKGPHRIRDLEIIYGKGEPAGYHRENGIKLWVNLSEAYFSPRLATIRKHAVDNVLKFSHNIVVDMYAGIGPITILLLKNQIKVYSFDINPKAVKNLKFNLEINKLSGRFAVANSNDISDCFNIADQIIMNNPSQDENITFNIIKKFHNKVIHLFILSKREDLTDKFRGLGEILEIKEVHGYSPSTSLYYILLRTRNRYVSNYEIT